MIRSERMQAVLSEGAASDDLDVAELQEEADGFVSFDEEAFEAVTVGQHLGAEMARKASTPGAEKAHYVFHASHDGVHYFMVEADEDMAVARVRACC